MTHTAPMPPSEIPDFEPVPTKHRHDGWTPARQRRFVEALLLFGSVARACRAVGISPAAAYKLRTHSQAASFVEAWDLALAMAHDRIFEQAVDRAMNGYTRPVRYAGKIIAQRHAFDNRLAYAVCYGEKPPRLS